jgi:catechol 2,3-dioxygenase-like lactoylglutathione lyase family enzyme
MPLFSIPDAYFLRVTNVAAAIAWYKEKFDLREFKVPTADGDEPSPVYVAYNETSGGIDFGTDGEGENRPILYAGKIKRAYELLGRRGVQLGPVQRDIQGTQYFEARDLDGNTLEISEEP